MRHHEDELLPLDDETPPLLAEGVYEAVILATRRPTVRFKRHVQEFTWRLTSPQAFDVRLPQYRNLGPASQPPRIKKRSKYAEWLRLVADKTGKRPSRLTLRECKQFWYIVHVGIITRDHRQRPLPVREHYNVVTEVVDIIGPLTSSPSDARARHQHGVES